MPSSRARRELKASEPRPPGLFLPHFGPPERARRHGTRQLEQRGSIRVGNDDESSLVDEGIGAKRADGRVEIQESDCYEKLGFGFSTMKKWTILCVIFVVQISMNFNTSVYANAITPMSKEFSLPEKTIRLGQMIFLVAYAFGCELWAPWSEELGRWPIMQLSLLLVNIWQVLCALAPSFRVIFAGRLLGGLSSAGGSVTLGMIADMWEADDQQFAVAFIVLSSVAGSVVGPISGGFMEVRLHWRWNFWIQLVAGIAVQLCHFLLVPETRATILLDREAKRMRRFGVADVYGPGEIHGRGYTFKELREIWIRPFSMFVREPIVLCLSLLSGFSDALIFIFLESYQPVFSQWGFGTIQVGLAFIPYVLQTPGGLLSGTLSGIFRLFRLFYIIKRTSIRNLIEQDLKDDSGGFKLYCIYMATIDYMIASSGRIRNSAPGVMALLEIYLPASLLVFSHVSRIPLKVRKRPCDLLMEVASLKHIVTKYDHPSYELVYPSLILSGIAFLVTIQFTYSINTDTNPQVVKVRADGCYRQGRDP
ncbi:multidrug transporter [Coccidioides immitis H538.4]|uniref:Multidrug transporter n=1 Tax=Coccidioides immitis H538.4 TaxID=396776 RepID=A0A0J8S185_COCIT|nr:multidrug transporter [Coccidioides immitis H538.4]